MWAAYRRPRAPSIPFLFCFDLLCIASRRAHVQGAAENTHRNERACPPFLGGDSIRRSGASAAAGKAGVGVAHPPRSVCTSSPPFAAPLCQPPPCASAVFCLASTAGLSALGPLMSGQSRHRAGGGGHSAHASHWAESHPRRNGRACSQAQEGAREGRWHRLRPAVPHARVLQVLPCRRAVVLSPPHRLRLSFASPPRCAPGLLRHASTASVSALGPLMSGQSRHRAVGGGAQRPRQTLG